jgi:hydroxyacylglutathione hydrolase
LNPSLPQRIKKTIAKAEYSKNVAIGTEVKMKYEPFCGGIFETNCYLFQTPEGAVLFDAPDGSCAWMENREVDLKLLLLTHGHIDHVGDVAKIKRTFNCPIGCHPDTAPMISDPDFFRNFGFGFEIEPASAIFWE